MSVCLIALVAANVILLSFASKRVLPFSGVEQVVIFVIAPVQDIWARSLLGLRNIWEQYFFLVGVAEENRRLHQKLENALADNHHCREIEHTNLRLRNLLSFQDTLETQGMAARVIAKDPSPWFKTIIIDKGAAAGLRTGLPVVVPSGIVGQITEVARNYAKVLLMIDPGSAADALVQRTRARGIIKGGPGDQYAFNYVLHKYDLEVGDIIISSGLDGVFPKGLKIGIVSEIRQNTANIFQEVVVHPNVNFEALEEVMVILDFLPADDQFES